MSALPPKADIGRQPCNVRLVPKADIPRCGKKPHHSITSSALASYARMAAPRLRSGTGWGGPNVIEHRDSDCRRRAMKLPRRKFLHLAAGTAALSALSRVASALDYPTRPVHLLVGFAAGGPLDTSARLIGQWLSERLGQPFVIENRPGAGSNLATEIVARAPPDGYTLLEASAANAWNAALYDNLSFNFIRDITLVAGVRRAAGVMEVNPSVPVKTIPEFIAYAKANPGKINMATGGAGSAPHLYGELFKMMAGVDLVTVNYRGSAPALPDLIAGQVQVMFDVVISSIGHIK